MRRWISTLAVGILLFGLTSTLARADFVVVVTIPPSGTGTLDFTVTSSSEAKLMDFNLALTISPTSSSTSALDFTPTQTDPYSDPNYVFATQSLGADTPYPFWSMPYPAFNPINIVGGDMADASVGPGYVTLASTPAYLGTVQFAVPQGAASGQQFDITLLSGPGNTEFDDQNGNPLSYTASYYGGTVNIDLSTVPEPSSLALATLVGLGSLVGYWRSQRKKLA